MSRRALASDLAIEDRRRKDAKESSVTSLALNSNGGFATALRKKVRNHMENAHVVTEAAWMKRLDSMRIADIEHFLQTSLKGGDETEVSRAEEEPMAVSTEAPVVEATSVVENDVDDRKSYASSTVRDAQSEDDVDLWYDAHMSELREKYNSLRVEQFRRRKSALRAEYWRRMDAIRNDVESSVINFS